MVQKDETVGILFWPRIVIECALFRLRVTETTGLRFSYMGSLETKHQPGSTNRSVSAQRKIADLNSFFFWRQKKITRAEMEVKGTSELTDERGIFSICFGKTESPFLFRQGQYFPCRGGTILDVRTDRRNVQYMRSPHGTSCDGMATE